MITDRVFTKNYPAPPLDMREIFRYAGIKDKTEEYSALLEECLQLLEGKLVYRVCYGIYPCESVADGLQFGRIQTQSKALIKTLSGASYALVFAATIGLEIDRLIARFGVTSPVKALFFQAIGAERIEALCDAFVADVKLQMEGAGMRLSSRFSPGYGDFPLEKQVDFFQLLQPQKRIGVTLTESLLMSPSKSVTAVFGIGYGVCEQHKNCKNCALQGCTYRE